MSDRLVILIIHLLSLRLRFRVRHQVLDFMLVRRVKYTMVLRNISRFNSIAIQDCLFDLILYVPSTIFQLNRDKSSWVQPVLS